MSARLLPRSVICLLPMVLLLAVAGCMGRWQLGDLGELLHPKAEAQPRSTCVNSGPVPCSERPHDAGTLPSGTSR
ncbi:MAG: hypothetical protein M3Y41_06430 [Pseudomonadota bacterium]|nr:hypothetical protein [Pseudomonadota bacterium]